MSPVNGRIRPRSPAPRCFPPTFSLYSTSAITCPLVAHGTSAGDADNTSQVIKRDAPEGITTTFYTCVDKAVSDPTALSACLSTEESKQDARLNSNYKALLGKLHGKAKDALVSAERAWLAFHNKSGDFEVSLYGQEAIDDLQETQNEIFRLCQRANALEKYLAIANDR